LIMDHQSEHIVLDEKAICGWLQNKSLSERLRRVVVGLSLKYDISTVVQSHPEDVMLYEPRATLRFKHKCMRKAMWGIIVSL